MKEQFCPIAHEPPTGFSRCLKFYGRMLFDFQTLTIFRHLKKILPFYEGKILDIGCGNSPFRFLVNSNQAEYIGLDIKAATDFGYRNLNKLEFDGENLPFGDNSIDYIIFTEVLEHIENPEKIIAEIYRVLKSGGQVVVTIPFSARVHYIPHDYCRYTPYKLQKLFSAFQNVEVQARGTDINSILAKVIVVFFTLIRPSFGISKNLLVYLKYVFRLLSFVILSPFVLLTTMFGHLELLLKLGSDNDPLGYTIILKK